jgi:hypothetical protein
MGKVLIDEITLTNIADSIRSKKGTTELINPANYASEISGITGGSSIENGFTVNFYNGNDLIESHIAKCGNDVYAPATLVSQYWTDENGVTYIFPFTTNEVGKVINLYKTGAGSCEAMIYDACGVDKNEYPYVLLSSASNTGTNKPVYARFFKRYTESSSGSITIGRADNITDGFIYTNYVRSGSEVTEEKYDILTMAKSLVQSKNDIKINTNTSTATINKTSDNYLNAYYTNFATGISSGRLDQELYLVNGELHPYALQEKTVTESGEVVPDDGYYGLSKVIVNI